MKVLHVQKATGIGGSERHLAVLLPSLVRLGVEVRMCVAVAAGGERLVEALRSSGVDTVSVPAGPNLNPLLYRRLLREIEAYRPDIVHTHLIHADVHGQPAARAVGVPGVSSAHGAVGYLHHQPLLGAVRLIGRLPRRTIAISRYMSNFLEKRRLRPPGTIRVVHYGIDAEAWRASPADRAKVRGQLGLESHHVAVIMAARLVAGKGHELLLEAVERAFPRAPDLRLIVAGEGPMRAQLERRAERLPGGSVRFLGFVDDVGSVVKACDVLASPTEPELGEGLGLAALEAMAAQLPVVATNVGALPELVQHGRTGMLVPPGRSAELARALVELSEQPELRESLGRNAGKRAAELFSVRAMTEGTFGVYRELGVSA